MGESTTVVDPILKDVIDSSCDQAELTLDEEQIIGHLHGLDRTKLHRIYDQLIAEKTDIAHWNDLLNKNVYKYFARKKSSQALMKDNPEDVGKLEVNYKEKLSELGEVISKHEKVRLDLLARFDDLLVGRNELLKGQRESISAFEDIVRDTGKSLKSLQSGQKLSPEDLENVMAQIQTTRKKMSEIRLNFIKTLDKHTQMEVKAIELQDLGNGLRMNDFSQLREERQCLEEKIEERNNTLEKLRLRCFADTQIISHVREKKYMLEGTEDEELQEVKETINEMDMTRSFMHDCNAKCENLRKLYKETSTNCGLLDKPELLRNYDDTKFEFKSTRENVERIRSEIDDINTKVSNATRILRQQRTASLAAMSEKATILNETQTNATVKSTCILQSSLQIKPYLMPS
ncbi:coiled-coil domain-containing protein 96-like [Bradysia coprophila]|uniref:coiled-coil domain-containing protein 96-like n=1 Tax=Bradysia coprophila TaxID=38358 RepID=UPI00187D7930|nr:coiled-coil domain-containing protein 96-like [Bradysia coprophila]